MCWSEGKRGWLSQPQEEERLEAGPAEAAIPCCCLPHIPRMPQWAMGCGFPSLALLFGWNFRKKIHKLRKKGISFLFCNLNLPLKDTFVPSSPSSLPCQGWGSSWNCAHRKKVPMLSRQGEWEGVKLGAGRVGQTLLVTLGSARVLVLSLGMFE